LNINESTLIKRPSGLFYVYRKKNRDIKHQLLKKNNMTYVVKEECIKCKLLDCVEVCPVDCFYEGKNMLVIKPDECIDCGVCEPECPIDAIKPDSEPGLEKWLEINTKYSEIWPNINQKKNPPADADNFRNEKNKYEKYFKENIE